MSTPETTGHETPEQETPGPETTGPETPGPETPGPETTGPETAGGGAEPAAVRRRSRGSTVLLVASLVVGALLLLWGLDRVARWGAESILARSIQVSTGALDRPEVQVNGFFVLHQVIQGRYDDVDVTIDGVGSGPLRVDRVEAELSGVYLSFQDVLSQDLGSLYVERARQVATLAYADLDAYLDGTRRSVRLTGAAGGDLQLGGTVEVLGRELTVSAEAVVVPDDGVLTITPTRLDAGTTLDRASELLLRQRFTVRVPLEPLPFGQVVTDVRTGEDDLTVEVRGAGVFAGP